VFPVIELTANHTETILKPARTLLSSFLPSHAKSKTLREVDAGLWHCKLPSKHTSKAMITPA